MKKKLVLFLAMLATMVVLVVGFAIGTSAQTYDVSTASDFTSKINSAASGDVINVTADISVGTMHTITKNLTVTSSNGSTVTATVDNLFSIGSDASTSGNLTIDGTLTISRPDSGTIMRMVNGNLTVQGNSTLSSGWTTVRMATDGGLVAESHVYVKGNATVEATINNENDYAFYVNGWGKANLHIQGGTVRHTAGYGISIPGGNIEVTGGTVTAMYGIFVWYDAGSASKTITIGGGTVEGSQTGIYFKENTKNCNLTVKGGTVRGGVHALDYRSTKDSSNNSINISGGTVTAASQTMFFYRCTALPVTVTGGTIEASDGGLTIYGAELRGNLTLNVSGTATRITATESNTINVTMPGNTSTYPGKLVATIEDGAISAGVEHAINVQNGTVTITGGTIAASTVAVYANKVGGTIIISGGTVTATTNTIVFQKASSQSLSVSGTAQIIATGNSAIMADAEAVPTIIISGGTITAGGDFCIDVRTGNVNISGGTLTANGYCTYLRGTVNYTITGGKLTAGANSVFAVSTQSGITLTISGGTFILNGGGTGAKIIVEAAASANCTVTVNGGVFINNNTENYTIIAQFEGQGNTVEFNGGGVLYKDNINSITSTPGNVITAPKNEFADYDANGDGIIDNDETYYVYGELTDTEVYSYVAVNTVTDENYLSLESAVEEASDGDIIDVIANVYLISEIKITKAITLTSSKGRSVTAMIDNPISVGEDANTSGSLTIDGDLTIISNGGTIIRMVNGTLTLQGNAKVTSNATTIRMASDGGMVAPCSVYVKGNALVEATSTNESDNVIYVNGSNGHLYLEGGTVSNPLGRGISFPQGEITVSGGLLSAKYGFYVWYNNKSAVKTITITGGTVEGSVTGIYINSNAKNCALTITGGTVCGEAHAIDYRAEEESSNNTITISGGLLTAPSKTVFFYHCSAVTIDVTGGVIKATNASRTIYGNELKGNLTLNVSGKANISAASFNAVMVSTPDAEKYPGKLNATISGGTIKAGRSKAINVQNGSVTISGGEIYAVRGSTVFADTKGGKITVTGGKIIGGEKCVFAIAQNEIVPVTDVTLHIVGGVMILRGTSESAKFVLNESDETANCKVTVDGGKFLYGENVQTLWDGVEATGTSKAAYDLNGDGKIKEDEIFYIQIMFAATNEKFSGKMEKGAAVQISEGGNGLKFTAVFTASAVKNLNNKAETGSTISYGMLILPTALLEQMDSYDTEALVALIGAEGCFHLVAGEEAQITKDASGDLILQAAITGIEDKTVSYSAIAYTCLKTGSEISYYFTAYNPADNARSAYEVAEAAIADAEAGYTVEQTAVLQTYFAPVKSLQLPTSDTKIFMLDDSSKKRWL